MSSPVAEAPRISSPSAQMGTLSAQEMETRSAGQVLRPDCLEMHPQMAEPRGWLVMPRCCMAAQPDWLATLAAPFGWLVMPHCCMAAQLGWQATLVAPFGWLVTPRCCMTAQLDWLATLAALCA